MQRMTIEQFRILRVGQELAKAGHVSLSEAHKIHLIFPRMEAGEQLKDEEVSLMAKVNLALFAGAA